MRLLYSIGINIATIVIGLLALFNTKLRLGVIGRKETFKKLSESITANDKTLWFHCASLGEYEQGLPVFEALKEQYPDHKVILSFFSPSGYQVKQNSKIADVVVYLPLDTAQNAKRFINMVHPDYVIFIKYEFWPNFLNEIQGRKIKAILISALFRKEQSFFKWYGTFMTSSLFAFQHIFTQDKNSKDLLKSINYKSVSVSGDTRFDRVKNQLNIDNSIPFIEEFKNEKLCIVFGSTWPEDDKLYMHFINNSKDNLKFIIAPHNINTNYIETLISQLEVTSVKYSDKSQKDLSQYKVFILDTIGYLSKAYSYADIAYVGGAAGRTGLHNILEPAVFNIPLIIGKNYDRFPEAKKLIALGGLSSVSSLIEFERLINDLIHNKNLREEKGDINYQFIEKNKGAVVQILNYIRI